MLIAVTFVLERFVPVVNILIMRISFSFIPMMFCGMLFGPVWGAVSYGIADILGWPLMEGFPIPEVLLSRVVMGFLFGFILHRENVRFFPHSVLSAFSTQIICGMGLTTFGLARTWGSPYIPLLVTRLPQIVVFIVMQLAVFPVLVLLRDALRKSGFVEE